MTDTLASNYTAGDSSMTVSAYTKWAAGQLVDPQDGTGSLYRVTATPTSSTLEITIAESATDANHSSGTVLYKDPAYTSASILNAINAALADMNGNGIYLTKTTTITPPVSTPTTVIYGLPTDFRALAVPALSQQCSSSITDIEYYSYGDFDVLGSVPQSVVATSKAIRINNFHNTTYPVYVFYQATLTLTNLPDGDIAELVVLLACKRLLGGTDMAVKTRSLARKRTITGAAPVQNASWFAREADILRHRIKVDLLRVSPRAKTYVR